MLAKSVYWVALAGLVMAAVPGWALENELMGVKLGQPAVDLLTRMGQPDCIGPMGGGPFPPAAPAQGPAAGQPLFGGVGQRAPGIPPGTYGTPGAGPGEQPLQYFPGFRSGPMGAQPTAPTAPPAPTGPPKRTLYWLYDRPGARLLVGVDWQGKVESVIAQGRRVYSSASTSKGIGLGSSYDEVVAVYGYQDRSQTVGRQLRIQFLDQGVSFTLEDLRIIEMAIGQASRPPSPPQPAQATPGAPVGPGMRMPGIPPGVGGQPQGGY